MEYEVNAGMQVIIYMSNGSKMDGIIQHIDEDKIVLTERCGEKTQVKLIFKPHIATITYFQNKII